jgi:hypothetical protein
LQTQESLSSIKSNRAIDKKVNSTPSIQNSHPQSRLANRATNNKSQTFTYGTIIQTPRKPASNITASTSRPTTSFNISKVRKGFLFYN